MDSVGGSVSDDAQGDHENRRIQRFSGQPTSDSTPLLKIPNPERTKDINDVMGKLDRLDSIVRASRWPQKLW